MKKLTSRFALHKTTLSNLTLSSVTGGTTGPDSVGCASIAMECHTIDTPCNPVPSRFPCYTDNCAGGGQRPPLPKKRVA